MNLRLRMKPLLVPRAITVAMGIAQDRRVLRKVVAE